MTKPEMKQHIRSKSLLFFYVSLSFYLSPIHFFLPAHLFMQSDKQQHRRVGCFSFFFSLSLFLPLSIWPTGSLALLCDLCCFFGPITPALAPSRNGHRVLPNDMNRLFFFFNVFVLLGCGPTGSATLTCFRYLSNGTMTSAQCQQIKINHTQTP